MSRNAGAPAQRKSTLDEMDGDGGEVTVAHLVVPPDGGWGWVVMFASFGCFLCIDGIIYNFGNLYLAPMAEEFQAPVASIALVGSLLQASAMIVGPAASALVNRYSFTGVVAFGSALSIAGFVAAYWANSVLLLYVTFGVLAGCGFGIIVVVTTVAISFYFQRWRSVATCFAMCGSTLGGVVVGPVLQYVIDRHQWRGAVLAQAAAMAGCFLLGLVFRPLKPLQVVNVLGGGSLNVSTAPSQISTLTTASIRRVQRNAEYPTAAQAVLSETSLAMLHSNVRRLSRESVLEASWAASQPSLANLRITAGPTHRVDMHHVVTGQRPHWWRCRCCWGVRWCGRKREHDLGARPLYRDDIFYGESVTRLQEYSQGGHIGYNMAVSRVATRKDVEQERSARWLVCPEAVTRTLATMLDVSLLRSPSFMLYAIINCLMQFALLVPFVYLPDRARNVASISEAVAQQVVAIMSLAGLAARLVLGVATSFPRVPLLGVSFVTLTLGGAAVAGMGLATGDAVLILCCSVFSVALATYYSMRSLLLVQLLGLDRLTNAFGLLLLFSGFASVGGPPLAGLVRDITGNYEAVFFLSGSLIAASGLLMWPLACVNRREKAAKGPR